LRGASYLVDVLALKLGEELLQALIVSLNANGGEDTLDVGGGGGLVATEAEEEVSCEVLHFEFGFCAMANVRRKISKLKIRPRPSSRCFKNAVCRGGGCTGFRAATQTRTKSSKKQGELTIVVKEEHEKSINLTASWAETEAFEFGIELVKVVEERKKVTKKSSDTY
jgi:hypothetical protein